MTDVSERNRTIIRKLAEEVAEIAALPAHAETADRWTRLNDMESVRPLVRIYQIPWREMNVDDELTLQTDDDGLHGIENRLRTDLYLWKHLPVDMVIEPIFASGYAVRSTGFGMKTDADYIPHDDKGGVNAIHYRNQLENEDDLEKITTPVITCDWDVTECDYQWHADLFDGILKVEKQGRVAHNYAPWDRLAEWGNPQQVLMDLIMRPDLIHKAMDRLVSAYMSELDQLEEQGLLSIGSGNYGVGQGGFGYTNQLPQADCDPVNVRLVDQWGGAMAQIFSEVSPEMHEEFALEYENRYLARFGLAYYGCCEPLDRKVDIIAKCITNLRKISMSPWVDAKRGAEAIGGRFVFSFKPNPAFLATDAHWDRNSARSEIESVLEATKGQHLELILKDVSTVRFEPRRLWEWADMAMELARQYE